MALFKISKGLKENLPATYNEGYCYFTTDDGKFYIDTSNNPEGRIVLNGGNGGVTSVNGLVGDVDAVSVDLEDTEQGEPALKAADLLGGYRVDELPYAPLELKYFNTVVTTDYFIEDSTYDAYPYKVNIVLPDVNESMIPDIIFGVTDAVSGNYTPVARTYDGGIYVWAKEIPESDLTIPVIIVKKGM